MIFSVDAYCFILHKVLHGHLDILYLSWKSFYRHNTQVQHMK